MSQDKQHPVQHSAQKTVRQPNQQPVQQPNQQPVQQPNQQPVQQPNQQPRSIIVGYQHSQTSSGPLPPPNELAAYRDVGMLETVRTLAEDANKRKNLSAEMDAKSRDAEIRQFEEDRKQLRENQEVDNKMFVWGACFLAFCILGCLAASVTFIWTGRWIGAAGFGLPGIGMLVNSYVKYMSSRK